MEKNRHIIYGFSVAEMLIVLTIVGLISTASFKTLTSPRVTNHQLRQVHGEAYCYYDKDRHLHSYFKNQDGSEMINEHIVGDTCVFPVIPSNYYSFFAIGAGSDGEQKNDTGYEISNLVLNRTWTVPADSRFQNAIASLPESLKQKFEDGAKACYTAKTAKGTNGAGCSGSYHLQGVNPPEIDVACSWDGGKGNEACIYDRTITLTESSVVDLVTTSHLTINKETIWKFKDNNKTVCNGGDATCAEKLYSDSCNHSEGGENGTDYSSSSYSTCLTDSTAYNRRGSRTDSGEAIITANNFTFNCPDVDITITYGTAGKTGHTINRTYTNLKAAEFIFQPGKNSGAASVIAYIKKADGKTTALFRTKEIDKNSVSSSSEIIISNIISRDIKSILPFLAKKAIADYELPTGSFNNMFNNKMIDSKGAPVTPGKGGNGSYPNKIVIKADDLTCKFTDACNDISKYTPTGTDNLEIHDVNACSLYGAIEDEKHICKATKGSGGGIFLTW